MTALPETRVVVLPDPDVLAAATAARLITKLIDIQSVRTPVHLVLTGGTVGIKTLKQVALSSASRGVDWTGVHFWWGDERFLPEGDPDRNETQAREALLNGFEGIVPAENVHFMPRPGDEGISSAEEAAQEYSKELESLAEPSCRFPSFDLLLLGVGPDGHVASLFPGHVELDSKASVTGVHDSPKPPPTRVSLTFEAINQARSVWLVVAGSDKAPAVASAFAGDPKELTPAGSVRGTEETLWLMDVAAASLLRAV